MVQGPTSTEARQIIVGDNVLGNESVNQPLSMTTYEYFCNY